MEQAQKLKVMVLSGGFSGEREISLLSGEHVFQSLDRHKYEVSKIDVVSETKWHWYGEDGSERALDLDREEDQSFLQTAKVFFNALHGTFGEDGKLQKVLDGLGVPYTGSGATASMLAIDKVQTMKYLANACPTLHIPEFFSVPRNTDPVVVAEGVSKKLSYPVIVKPNDSGSTLGLSLVQRQEELAGALEKAQAVSSSSVIVQRYIFGREFTCGVLGNATDPDLFLLPPVEIIIKNQVFDFNDKYFSKETQELCPAPITSSDSEKVQEVALLAHRTLGCDGLSRSDFRMDGTGKIFFLETNTSPGLTAMSLCPKEAKAAGIAFHQLLDRIIDLGLSRHAQAM